MTDHPITPPHKLKQQWLEQASRYGDSGVGREEWLMERSAEWGADQRGEVNEAELQQARDQELEACCEAIKDLEWFEDPRIRLAELRATRRPKPPSLKEQALEQLDGIAAVFRMTHGGDIVCDTIRRALEALPND